MKKAILLISLLISTSTFAADAINIEGNINVLGNANRITGEFTTSTHTNKLMFQTNANASNTEVTAVPSPGGAAGVFAVCNNSTGDNCAYGALTVNGAKVTITSNIRGSGTQLPLDFLIGSTVRQRINTDGKVSIGSSINNAVDALQVYGSAYVSTTIKLGVYTVSTLPTGSAGMKSFVSDALTPTFGAVATGGGAVFMPVYHDGTNWRIG